MTDETLRVDGDLVDAGKQVREPDFGKWQPIETAPRDGTWFVICRAGEDDSIEVGRYDPHHWYTYDEVEDGLFKRAQHTSFEFTFNNYHRATHWMPLPEPPQ